MKIADLDERVIDMQSLANKAKQLLEKGMSEQQIIQLLVKEGTPVRLAQQAVAAAQINEAPIQGTDDPNDPMIYGHNQANPMTLKGRIVQARKQLRELAAMAESDELIVWEKITRLAKGGMFMGLEQNLEQIRYGIDELVAKRKKGGISSRGIDRNIGEKIKFAGDTVGQRTGDAGQVKGIDQAKRISPVLGAPEKSHPFKGKLVGGGA